MNLREIALRVAKKMRAESEWDVLDLVCNSENFAEALIAEIAKQNEPLCTAAMLDEWFLSKSGVDPKLPLYTIPPTAEQIANETAEAVADYLTSGRYMVLNPDVLISAEQHTQYIKNHDIYQANVIRRGAWKEFK